MIQKYIHIYKINIQYDYYNLSISNDTKEYLYYLSFSDKVKFSTIQNPNFIYFWFYCKNLKY